MHAFLGVGQNKDLVRLWVQKKVKSLGSRLREFPVTKIADVKEMNNYTRLKLTEKTVIVIGDFDKATSEAQNSFLKALEEPQEDLSYILTASSSNNILPTIISRCEVIEVEGGPVFSREEEERALEFITAKVGQRLKTISKITKREDAVKFVKNIIIVGHTKMINDSSGYWMIADEASKTVQNLEANGNVQLQLTNFVINISN